MANPTDVKVSWRDGLRVRVAADVAHAEFERLRADGALTASRVFEAARPKKAALNGEFEWNGAEAVKQLGLQRARVLLRGLVEVSDAAAPGHARFVHVPAEDPQQAEGSYVLVREVAATPDQYERAVLELTQRLAAAERALEEVKQFAGNGVPPEQRAALDVLAEGFTTLRAALRLLRPAA